MAVDVQALMAQYEDVPKDEPMHGQQGQIRRNPSTDQRKVRRQMTKKAEQDVASVATIAELRQQAALAQTLEQKTALIAEAERLESERRLVTSAARALDLTVKEAVEIIPAGTHELHTEATDWITAVAAQSRGSSDEATRELVACASLWYQRVPPIVKADPEEFVTQAVAKARYEASPWGEHAAAAANAFTTEAERLYNLEHRVSRNVSKTSELIHDLDNGGMVEDPGERPYAGAHRSDERAERSDYQGGHRPGDGKVRPSLPEQTEPAVLTPAAIHGHMPDIHAEFDRVLRGDDVAGVRQMAEGYASQQQTHHGNLTLTATARMHGETEETINIGAMLAGFDVTAQGPLIPLEAEAIGGEGGMGGGIARGLAGGDHHQDPIGSGIQSLEHSLDSSSSGVGDAASNFAHQQVTSASTVPQVGSQGPGGSSGLPTATFDTFGGPGSDALTDSNRAPALQEIANDTGWDGTSVVPQGDSGAAAANADFEGQQDASINHPADFPLGSSYASVTKESAMTVEHRECPTCGGHGKVAVRKEAYSGLPQIDQIVNADESPGTTPLPQDVAFPLTGWGQTPQQGQQNVQNAITQAEQQVSERNSKSPLLTSGASLHQAGYPDASGWMGDMGAKGPNYEGYSSPTGYDGSNNLGEPDPVYGYGGDQGQRGPLKPYGAEEANDITNNPGEPYDPSVPHNNDQAYRQVSPGMTTQGSADPFIAAAQHEILRQQDIIRARMAASRG